MGTGHDGHSEDLPRMNQHGIENSHSHDGVTLDPPSGVEHQDHEEFDFRIEVRIGLHMQPPVVGRPFRCIAFLNLRGGRTIPNGDQLPFARLALGPDGPRALVGGGIDGLHQG